MKKEDYRYGLGALIVVCLTMCVIVEQMRGCEESVAKYNAEVGKVSNTFKEPFAELHQAQEEMRNADSH